MAATQLCAAQESLLLPTFRQTTKQKKKTNEKCEKNAFDFPIPIYTQDIQQIN